MQTHHTERFDNQVGLTLPAVPSEFNLDFALAMQDKLVLKARASVHKDFQDKFRKLPKGLVSTALPYVVHLEEVAQLLAAHGYSASVIAAAYTHDNIEDLPKLGWTKERLAAEFNPEVADLVDWVTQLDKTLPWIERQEKYLERLWHAPSEAVALSVADKISNMEALIFWMQRGYKVEEIIAKDWKVNSDKLHALNQLYSQKLPGTLTKLFERSLRQFDRLGQRQNIT